MEQLVETIDSVETVDEFCHREYERLFGTLRLYVGDLVLAEDLTQEALARAVKHWPRVRNMDAPGAWLHRVSINLANSAFRRRRALRRAEVRAGPAPDSYEDRDSPTVVAVREAVRSLAPRQREVIVLRFFQDLPVRATAERMGCAEGTVKGLLADAIRALRESGLEVEDDE
ncbi:MAG TPA: sigma-70 family RNA polymerase sigma factor [Acidimicrobiales bacterium]|nr:sigma-70 family RNA polymerase sigma factor [Acidimicrobiales bacterium]